MKSNLRLHSVMVPEKTAVVTVDHFYANNTEHTVGWLKFERLSDGNVLYSLREDGGGMTIRGAAPTVGDAVDRATALVDRTCGPVANPIEFDSRDGLDNMGLWTALGTDG